MTGLQAMARTGRITAAILGLWLIEDSSSGRFQNPTELPIEIADA
jgi:hypothetical protein